MPVILVAPLNWGLGHASRCIPVIHHLITLKCKVIIACNGAQKALLEKEFKGLHFIDLPTHHITYSTSALFTKIKLLLQFPGFLTSIKKENRWLQKAINQYQIKLVISDNRYGLYSNKIPCIFITHQLRILSSLGKIADDMLQRVNYRYITKFSCCWVPDNQGNNNLAGVLSHPKHLPHLPVKYIGPLSRFSVQSIATPEKHLLIILSGPEPQRSLLEAVLLKELPSYKEPVIMLRGLPADSSVIVNKNTQLTIYNHLPTDAFQELVRSAKVIICRSGYSSVMDLLLLNKTCVFIPTPGQPEQVYLAASLAKRKLCLSYDQNNFAIKKMLNDLQEFRKEAYDPPVSSLREIVEATLAEHVLVD